MKFNKYKWLNEKQSNKKKCKFYECEMVNMKKGKDCTKYAKPSIKKFKLNRKKT